MSENMPLAAPLLWFSRRIGRPLGVIFLLLWRLTHSGRPNRAADSGPDTQQTSE